MGRGRDRLEDPVALATFWAEVTGGTIDDEVHGDPPRYVAIAPADEHGTWLTLQRVPEAKAAKNRLHLDLYPEDLDAASARIEAIGGARVSGADVRGFGFRWRVMADPAGNEFCLIVRDGT
jgi:predicted enzyme related to lactoylglutathione lyase